MCNILFIWQIAGTDKFIKVVDFLRRQLHRETLVDDYFVYVNSAFSPNLDELVIDLYNVIIQLKLRFCYARCVCVVHKRCILKNDTCVYGLFHVENYAERDIACSVYQEPVISVPHLHMSKSWTVNNWRTLNTTQLISWETDFQ
ncbi:unnamed protein product [Ilex paraguariensis]|uniref:Ubiquitin-like protein ATG12 n=1 Tax=Ilex paraguariensis TaxID=185542 RepID=A0ABC8UFV8_9AQUA